MGLGTGKSEDALLTAVLSWDSSGEQCLKAGSQGGSNQPECLKMEGIASFGWWIVYRKLILKFADSPTYCAHASGMGVFMESVFFTPVNVYFRYWLM